MYTDKDVFPVSGHHRRPSTTARGVVFFLAMLPRAWSPKPRRFPDSILFVVEVVPCPVSTVLFKEALENRPESDDGFRLLLHGDEFGCAHRW